MIDRLENWIERHERTVFSPLEQRVYGLIKVAEGLWMVVFGKYTPSWTLRYAMWGATRSSRKRGGG